MHVAKTCQLIVLVSAGYNLGIFTGRFTSGLWDWGTVAALLAYVTILLVYGFALIRDFWKLQ